MRDVLQRLIGYQDIPEGEAYDVMTAIMSGEVTPAQIAGFLVAMRMKGETVDEITGFARAMRDKVIRVHTQRRPIVDTCGTGGDGSGTFNISTAAAIVAAGAGVCIAKHGNRAVSSRCGSADVLEALGVRLNLDAKAVGQCLDEVGIAFLFAPALHPAMQYAVTPRRELGVRTVFNLLGPLTNPAGASAQVMGVYSRDLVEPIASVLAKLGAERAFVVHGHDGVDEISLSAPTEVAEVRNGETRTYRLQPKELGLNLGDSAALAGDTAEVNAQMIRDIMDGRAGPALDVTVLNAAAVLMAAGVAGDWNEGMELARETILSGKAEQKLEQWVAFTEHPTVEP